MSNGKPQSGINVLQNITLKVLSGENSEIVSPKRASQSNTLVHEQNSSDKKNCIHPDSTSAKNEGASKIRRHTLSMCMFDEEPVFSDSDEEKKYDKDIIKECSSLSHNKQVHVGVQCDLTYSNQIIDVIKICANFEVENYNEDFRELILLCKNLQCRYQINNENATKNSSTRKASKSGNSSQHCSPTPLLPSRYGSANHFSEDFNFEGIGLSNNIILDENSHEGDSNPAEGNKIIFKRSSKTHKHFKRKLAKKNEVEKYRKNAKKRSKNYNLQPTRSTACNNRKDINRIDVDPGTSDMNLASGSNKKLQNSKNKITAKFNNSCDNSPTNLRLSKRQVRSLARNWMKPNKSKVMSPYKTPGNIYEFSFTEARS